MSISASGIGRQNQHAIIGAERCPRIADELIAVQVGGERRLQTVADDDLGKGGQLV